MKVILAAASLTLAVGVTPAFAADYKTEECFSGQYREALCHPEISHRGKTIVVDEREPDVLMLPYAPYVEVNEPRR